MPKLDLAGIAINVRVAGQCPPVISLHSSSSHGDQWKRLSDAICDRFRVLAPDFNGYGQGDPLPQDGRSYFQHEAAIVNTLLDTITRQPIWSASLSAEPSPHAWRSNDRTTSRA